jgi:transcriptional regulator GlxA family with amidase domain
LEENSCVSQKQYNEGQGGSEARWSALDDKKATTHWTAISRLKGEAPMATVLENTRFVDNGQVLTTAGVSAGIDGALHIMVRFVRVAMIVRMLVMAM